MENSFVTINFRFNADNQYFIDQLKNRIACVNFYINNIDFSEFAFSDFLDLLSEIYDSYEGDFDISLSE